MARYKNGVVREGQVFYNGEWHTVEKSPKMDIVEKVMDEIYQEEEGIDATVTSIIEGHHSVGSLHPEGEAEDFRTWTKERKQMDVAQKVRIAVKAKDKLGEDYDVVVEDNHIHIEYDPR